MEFLRSTTFHRRKAEISNQFTYGVDFIGFDPETRSKPTSLFSFNRLNLFSYYDKDHGSQEENANPTRFVRSIFEEAGLVPDFKIWLLTQPRMFGLVFNPVSFWFALSKSDEILAMVAEVNNTFKQRHFYLCANEGFAPIKPEHLVKSDKVFYVSPFQDIAGKYLFSLKRTEADIAIRIDLTMDNGEGVIATVAGARKPLRNRDIMMSSVRRPLGGARVLALIMWQALKLKFKGAVYRVRPKKPDVEVS